LFSVLHSNQTGSGAHPGSCTMGTGGSFPRDKGLEREDEHSHLEPRLRMCEAIFHSYIRIHEVVLNSAEGQFYRVRV
jgi:hypothetical protein